MENKKFGFTIMELLVVIMIICILSSISVPTLNSYIRKTHDAGRKLAIQTILLIVKADGGDQWRNEKYMYSVNDLEDIFNENDFNPPQGENDICYLVAMAHNSNSSLGNNNEFVVVTWGMVMSTINDNLAGPIIAGTTRFENAIKNSLITLNKNQAGILDAGDFSCDSLLFTDVITKLDSVISDNSDLDIAYYIGINKAAELVSIGEEYK
ncbi:prepilin-type N-terminal cleavage/methylation domain-containing protein [Candidatus Gracilibacteria bacterium]|nr:prepilin-type N-terminal cleavage/methylation domain-containing protein [Candidatus Gracilibacteria bacterium]